MLGDDSAREPARAAMSQERGPGRGGRTAAADQPAAHAAKAAIGDGLREHVERSPLAIAVVDCGTHAVCYANAAFRALNAGGTAPLPGASLADTLTSSASERVDQLLREVEETGTPRVEVEVDVVAAAGAHACWRVTVWPTPQGQPKARHLVLQVRDATGEQRNRVRHAELVEQLREINERLLLASFREADLRDRAQEANQAKTAFLATMSHELRTPLTAIIGYEELLADEITGPISDAQRAQLRRIKGSAQHLLALIDEILTFARVEAGREVTQRETVRVDDLVESASASISPLASSKGLTYQVLLSNPSLELWTDPLKLRQVLVNLLGNAVKFTDCGSIVLSVREVGDQVVFEVRDTGIGIAAEHIEHIFAPFWQVQQTPNRRVGGSGLGLSVSRRLAGLLDGELHATSELGKGSTFTLSLPRAATL